MRHPDKIGNVSNIIEMIQTQDYTVTEGRGNKVFEFGAAPDYDRIMAAHKAEREHREANGGLFGRERQKLLCSYQSRCYRAGYCPLSISTNIYGYVCGSRFVSNMRGGRFGMTSRGASLESVLKFAFTKIRSGSNTTLKLWAGTLPDEVIEALGIE